MHLNVALNSEAKLSSGFNFILPVCFTAELSALQRQRSAEMFLHNLTSSISQQRHLTPQVISNGYYETPTLPSVNPLYENLEETQQRLVGPINDVHMTECPAYVTMPTKL